MNNNFQDQFHNGHSPVNNTQGPAGSVWRTYRQQQQASPVMSPLPSPGLGGSPPTSNGQVPFPSPFPVPSPHGPAGFMPPRPKQQSQQAQSWLGQAMQTVRTLSGKLRSVSAPVDQNPLVLYRPNKPPILLPPKSKRWKRSRSVRVAMLMHHRRRRWKKARPKTGRIWAGILISFCLLIVLAASAGTAYAYSYYQSQLPQLQGLANHQIDQTTRFYDRNGVLLYEFYNQAKGSERSTTVSYDYIPMLMQQTQTSAEDPTFWDNAGVDPQSIVRALIQNAQSSSIQSGASTITQQVIKNLSNNTDQTIFRKISEATLAIGLTQQYSKAKILEMYFNIASYGAQDQGIEAAVEDYFHLQLQCDAHHNCIPGVAYLTCATSNQSQCDPYPKPCNPKRHCDSLLGLARASLLAGMPQNPVIYDPTRHVIDSQTNQPYYLERQDYVLGQMKKLSINVEGVGPVTDGVIQQVEALTAKLTFTPYKTFIRAPHFVNWVIDQLYAKLGSSLATGGFNVYTTIDVNLETYVENAVHRHLDLQEYQKFLGGYGPLNTVNNVNDAAVVVMDAKTGEILAMDGSSNYWDTSDPQRISGQTNMAVRPRQPGSSIKPIVYTTAFQQGWYPGMVLPDVKTYFPTGACVDATNMSCAYTPVDYGGGYSKGSGAVSVRAATANSRNVPAVKAAYFAGFDNIVHTAQRMGITTLSKADQVPSFALGTSGIPLVQMVGAYQTFANQGTRIPPKSVLDIWDNYGHHLYHFDPTHPGGVQIISPQIAYLMTSVLKDEVARYPEFAPDHDLSFYDWDPTLTVHEVAAKTGTTDSYKDNLAIGYTPDVVVGVWAGNANDEIMNNVVGITGAAPIWHSVIERVMGRCNVDTDNIACGGFVSHYKDYTFPPPPNGVVQQCVSAVNGLAPTSGAGTNCDWILQSEIPQQTGIAPGSTGNPPATPTP